CLLSSTHGLPEVDNFHNRTLLNCAFMPASRISQLSSTKRLPVPVRAQIVCKAQHADVMNLSPYQTKELDGNLQRRPPRLPVRNGRARRVGSAPARRWR